MIALMLTFAGLAHADAVGPDATGCPDGSRGTANHNGSFCTPDDECSTADACRDDQTCEATSLCILEEERPCGGRKTPGYPCTYTHVEALGRCDSNADCDQGTCVTADRCVENAGLDLGCSSTGAIPSLAFGIGLVGLGLLGIRRRS